MSIPRYRQKVTEIIKYKTIDSEVRCGRYYNSVWVEKKKEDINFYGIPLEEQDDFHKKLQAELRYCIDYENLSKKKNIIILFKSCFLALRSFEKKRILSLGEIKRILAHTCSQRENS